MYNNLTVWVLPGSMKPEMYNNLTVWVRPGSMKPEMYNNLTVWVWPGSMKPEMYNNLTVWMWPGSMKPVCCLTKKVSGDVVFTYKINEVFRKNCIFFQEFSKFVNSPFTAQGFFWSFRKWSANMSDCELTCVENSCKCEGYSGLWNITIFPEHQLWRTVSICRWCDG